MTALLDRVRWWQPRVPRSPAAIAVTIAACVNLFLAGAWLWSRGGETTDVRIEARGDRFVALVDGRQEAVGRFDAPETGGFRLTLEDTGAIPSLPRPRGIDSVKVTDLDSGKVLFEDNFSRSPKDNPAWTQVLGELKPAGGVLGAGREGMFLRSYGHDWRNYAIDVRYRNITAGTIRLRADDDQSGVDFTFRPFRHLDSTLALIVNGRGQSSVAGPPLELTRSETMRSIAAIALEAYPKLLLLLLAGLVLVGALQFARPPVAEALRITLPWQVKWIPVAALAAAAFGATLFLSYSYGSHMPHVPDSVSYVFQAKILASGRLSAPTPPSPTAFDFFFPPLIELHHGKWASVYPFGHPLVLAIGERIGAIWLVPPAVGAGCVALMWAVGRRVYDVRVGLLAALLFAASPFFMMSAADFMSHNTAAFYVLMSVLFLACADRRPLLFPFLAGLFFGLLFNTRPLTAVGLVPPFGVLLLSWLVPRDHRKTGATQLAAFLAGGLLMLAAYYGYTWGATGSPFTVSDTQANANNVGFGGRHSVSAGMSNEQAQLALLALVLNDWPVYFGVAFLLLPFILGTRHRWDWFLLACAVTVVGVYTVYYSTGVMYGPRYWYEATPFLLLLTARGTELAGQILGAGAARLRARLTGATVQAGWAGLLVAYAFVAAVTVAGGWSWLRRDSRPWRVDLMPARAKDLRYFNGADDHFTQILEDAHLRHALVLMQQCPNWQCYGSVFWMNTPDLDGNVVFARKVDGAALQAVFDAYPDRHVYVGDWAARSLVPYGETPAPEATPASPDSGPLAGDIATMVPSATPTPAPTPTIDVTLVPRRDQRRRDDLTAIADALDGYRQQHGSYPQVNGVQTLCGYPSDVGCVLKEKLDPLPTDPLNNQSYWYTSDGASFTLFAQAEEPPGPSQCPTPAPQHLAGVPNLYCVRREGL